MASTLTLVTEFRLVLWLMPALPPACYFVLTSLQTRTLQVTSLTFHLCFLKLMLPSIPLTQACTSVQDLDPWTEAAELQEGL